MVMSSNGWLLSLDLNGGRINELLYKGVKIFGTYNRIDGKQGSTHLCVPCFDKEGGEKYNLPFHGLVRNEQWGIEQQTENTVVISTITQPSSSYPASLKVEQTFTVGANFEHIVTVFHLGGEPVPVNIGIHYYWDTPKGWDEIKIQNQKEKEKIKINGYIDLQENNTIMFPHAAYEMNLKGLSNAVLWTSFAKSEKGISQYSQDFCCIEPVIGWPEYFGSNESILSYKEIKRVSTSLHPLLNPSIRHKKELSD